MYKVRLSEIIENLASYSDSTINLVGVAPIPKSDDNIHIQDKLQGNDWINFCKGKIENKNLQLQAFESIWDNKRKELKLVLESGEDLECECLYFVYGEIGEKEANKDRAALMVYGKDAGDYINLCKGYNLFTLNINAGTIVSN